VAIRVIRARHPTRDEIAALLGRADAPFGYPEVGATANRAVFDARAAAYYLDRHERVLGTGRALYDRARAALLAWRHFEIPWLELHGAEAPVDEGQVVATLTRVAGVWFCNPCRVVYVETASPDQVAFAYGALAGHVERGEERFSIRCSEHVCYEIAAFSRPALPIAMLALPWVRRIQHRFARDSAEALARACGEGYTPP
jgi:uncharacterized protein (UPF0548 family)